MLSLINYYFSDSCQRRDYHNNLLDQTRPKDEASSLARSEQRTILRDAPRTGKLARCNETLPAE